MNFDYMIQDNVITFSPKFNSKFNLKLLCELVHDLKKMTNLDELKLEIIFSDYELNNMKKSKISYSQFNQKFDVQHMLETETETEIETGNETLSVTQTDTETNDEINPSTQTDTSVDPNDENSAVAKKENEDNNLSPSIIVDAKNEKETNIIDNISNSPPYMVIYFDENSEKVSETDKIRLKKVKDLIEPERSLHLYIWGYADSLGDSDYNELLSMHRVKAIEKILIENGFSEEQLELKAFGEVHVFGSNNTEEGRHLNRRVEIRIKQ